MQYVISEGRRTHRHNSPYGAVAVYELGALVVVLDETERTLITSYVKQIYPRRRSIYVKAPPLVRF